MDRGKVIIAAPVHPVLAEGLKKQGYTLLYHLDITQEKALEIVQDVAGIITSTRLQVNKEMMDAAPRLQWIGRMGSGMEVIDRVYAKEKNIRYYSSPEGNANAVAEHALGMLLALANNILISNVEVKEGIWKREENRGFELEGKTIGIIGYGHTGPALAQKLKGFNMKILVYDKYRKDIHDEVMVCETLQPIFEEADVISFHVPLSEETRHYFNDDFLQKCAKPIIIINTSRGNVVDTDTLIKGFLNEKIKAACLDVFEEEPIEKMSPEVKKKFLWLTRQRQVMITPHIAGYSKESLFKMSELLLNRIVIDK